MTAEQKSSLSQSNWNRLLHR